MSNGMQFICPDDRSKALVNSEMQALYCAPDQLEGLPEGGPVVYMEFNSEDGTKVWTLAKVETIEAFIAKAQTAVGEAKTMDNRLHN